MKHIDPKATVRPTPEAKGYLDVLKKNGAFGRAIDAYVFAAAYALKNKDIRQMASTAYSLPARRLSILWRTKERSQIL